MLNVERGTTGTRRSSAGRKRVARLRTRGTPNRCLDHRCLDNRFLKQIVTVFHQVYVRLSRDRRWASLFCINSRTVLGQFKATIPS